MPTHMLLKVTTLSAETKPGDISGAPLVELTTDNTSSDDLKDFAAKRIGLVLTHHHGSLIASDAIAMAKSASARTLNIIIPGTSDIETTKTAMTDWIKAAQTEGVSLCFETTPAVLKTVKNASLPEDVSTPGYTLNLSHINLQDHSPADPAAVLSELKPVLNQVEIIRVNQPGPAFSGDLVRLLWEEAMRQWRRQNKPGSTMLGLLHPADHQWWPTMQDAWKGSARPS